MILKIISLHQIQEHVIISQKRESLTLKNLQWQNPITSTKPPLIACVFSSFFSIFTFIRGGGESANIFSCV